MSGRASVSGSQRSLDGKTALVTGGGTGIGFGCARRLAEQGARVTLAARRQDVLEKAAERLRDVVPGVDVRIQRCDITVEDDVAAAVAMAADAQGRLDVAVANAGSGVPGPILFMKAEHWRSACDLNILGTALTIKHAGLAMKEHGGSIVTISSVAAVKLERFMSTYSATKAGMETLVRCAALELAPYRIRVNCIQPGYVPTEATDLAFSRDEAEALVARDTPLGRPGLPEEIGDAVVYFSAPSGEWVTGQVIAVDGGMALSAGADFERICRLLYGDAAVDACIPEGNPRTTNG